MQNIICSAAINFKIELNSSYTGSQSAGTCFGKIVSCIVTTDTCFHIDFSTQNTFLKLNCKNHNFKPKKVVLFSVNKVPCMAFNCPFFCSQYTIKYPCPCCYLHIVEINSNKTVILDFLKKWKSFRNVNFKYTTLGHTKINF